MLTPYPGYEKHVRMHAHGAGLSHAERPTVRLDSRKRVIDDSCPCGDPTCDSSPDCRLYCEHWEGQTC